jgi:hypothetical protein
MEKKWTLTITAVCWSGGFSHELTLEETTTTAPDWDTVGIAEWINDGKDFEDLRQIIEHAEEHDVKYTVTARDENGNITYTESMWESDAAKIAMEV